MCSTKLLCSILVLQSALNFKSSHANSAAVEVLDESATGGLEIGAPLEQEPDFLCQALYHAVTHGDTAKVQLLLEQGADVNMPHVDHLDEGETPVLRAATYDREDVITLLIRYGAHIQATNTEGKTSLMIAASLGNLRAMHAVLRHPLYAPHAPPAGLTDLVAAGEFREPEALASVHESSLEARDRHGKTALAWASYMGQAEAARELLKRGANVEARDLSGRSPLMWAVTGTHGRLATVDVLLQYAASVSAKDGQGSTALNWAIERGHKDVLEVLVKHEYGADTEFSAFGL